MIYLKLTYAPKTNDRNTKFMRNQTYARSKIITFSSKLWHKNCEFSAKVLACEYSIQHLTPFQQRDEQNNK